jgi:hypothetical protein
MRDVAGFSKQKIPAAQYKAEVFNKTSKFREFLQTVIVCTEEGTDQTELSRLAQLPYTL